MGQAGTNTKLSGLNVPLNCALLKLVTMLKFCRFDSSNKAQTPFWYHTKFPPQLKQINRVPKLICSFVLEVWMKSKDLIYWKIYRCTGLNCWTKCHYSWKCTKAKSCPYALQQFLTTATLLQQLYILRSCRQKFDRPTLWAFTLHPNSKSYMAKPRKPSMLGWWKSK